MSVCKIGTIKQSINISKNYEKQKKVIYTALNLGTQDKVLSKEKELEENHLHAKYFGIASHYCLEMMSEFTLDALKYSLKLAQSRYSNYLSEIDFKDIENRISLMLSNDKFISMLNDSEFITEQSLIYKEEIKIIDLLLFKEDTYYIIDYKTTKDRLPEHIVQVAFYKKAIKDIFNTANVKSYLVYLHSNENFIQEV
jgi:exodeoxyribonuclease V beta subunit